MSRNGKIIMIIKLGLYIYKLGRNLKANWVGRRGDIAASNSESQLKFLGKYPLHLHPSPTGGQSCSYAQKFQPTCLYLRPIWS